ncbi:MAG: DNA/RNA helicase domain-containing protein, partial [Candidatus Limnocylindrales bacterium]
DFVRQTGAWSNERARRYQLAGRVRDAYQLRVNAYRVLLTRARDACIVFVPPIPLLDETYSFLRQAGFQELGR